MTAILLTYLIGAVIVGVVILYSIHSVGGADKALDEVNAEFPDDEQVDSSEFTKTVLFLVFLWPFALLMFLLYFININKEER